jgi:hypothetical protein
MYLLYNCYFSTIMFSPGLRSHIIFIRLRLGVKVFIRLRLGVKVLIRLRLLPFCVARQNFKKELKFKHMLKLSFHLVLYDLYCSKYELNGL